MRARFNKEVHFLNAGDFNKVDVTDVLLFYGALQEVCEVATQKDAALQLVSTDLHTILHPSTAISFNPPVQVDKGSKGITRSSFWHQGQIKMYKDEDV